MGLKRTKELIGHIIATRIAQDIKDKWDSQKAAKKARRQQATRQAAMVVAKPVVPQPAVALAPKPARRRTTERSLVVGILLAAAVFLGTVQALDHWFGKSPKPDTSHTLTLSSEAGTGTVSPATAAIIIGICIALVVTAILVLIPSKRHREGQPEPTQSDRSKQREGRDWKKLGRQMKGISVGKLIWNLVGIAILLLFLQMFLQAGYAWWRTSFFPLGAAVDQFRTPVATAPASAANMVETPAMANGWKEKPRVITHEWSDGIWIKENSGFHIATNPQENVAYEIQEWHQGRWTDVHTFPVRPRPACKIKEWRPTLAIRLRLADSEPREKAAFDVYHNKGDVGGDNACAEYEKADPLLPHRELPKVIEEPRRKIHVL